MKLLTVLSASLFLLLLSQPAFCSSLYTVTLVNGNVLEANSCTIRDGKVYLKYPVGEGAFQLRQVVSIKAGDGSVVPLQSEGVFVPKPVSATSKPGEASVSPAAAAASPPVSGPDDILGRRQEMKEVTRSLTGGAFGSDSRTNDLVDQSFRATTDEERARADKALQELFDEEDDQAGIKENR